MLEFDLAADRVRQRVAANADTSGFVPRKSTVTPGTPRSTRLRRVSG
jgi:hypothetical protein